MKTKLIMVEGLPGFGKSTTAKLLHDIMIKYNKDVDLFLEGNLDHPADYDGVSCFNRCEFVSLLENSGDFKKVINERVIKREGKYFLPYRKLKNEYGSKFDDDLLHTIFQNDIYELPLEKNIELITKRWAEFADKAVNENKIYIFECCFIQNPLTVGMVKYGAKKDQVIDYVLKLEKIIEKLNPALFYIEQEDLEFSFKKAVKERPKEWSSGFVEYYTAQGYGKSKGYSGIEGTINVLEARKEMEREIVDKLNIKKAIINNSHYETINYKSIIIEKLYSLDVLD